MKITQKDNEIRCILSYDDLLEYGIDLTTSKEEVLKGLKISMPKILEKIFMEAGIDMPKNGFEVEINKPVGLILEMVIHEELSPTDKLLKVLEGISKDLERRARMDNKLPKHNPSDFYDEPLTFQKDNVYIYKFVNMKSLRNFVEELPDVNFESRLYKDKEYYLVVDKYDEDIDELAVEHFAEASSYTESFLKENAQTIIMKKAIEVIADMN